MREKRRPLGAGIQVQASNYPWVLYPKDMVLSAREKAVENSQVSDMELNESEDIDEASLIRKCSQNQLFFDHSGISPEET